jgi:hypothetical protein
MAVLCVEAARAGWQTNAANGMVSPITEGWFVSGLVLVSNSCVCLAVCQPTSGRPSHEQLSKMTEYVSFLEN